MLEVLQFIFSGFWTFVGVCILISAIGWAVARIVLAIRGIVVVDVDDSDPKVKVVRYRSRNT